MPANDVNAVSPYTVQVTVDGCISEFAVPAAVTVHALPPAVASNDGPICTGEPVTLLGGQVENASYQWREVGNPTILSTSQNATLFGVTTTTTYELTVVANGCVSDPIATTTVVVSPTPTAAPTATTTDICAGGTLELFANATNGTTFTWSGPNGFLSSSENPVRPNVTPADNGNYTLTVTSNQGCEVISTIFVGNIIDNPVTPAITSNGPVCIDDDIVFGIQQNYNGTTVNYTWTNGVGTVILSLIHI